MALNFWIANSIQFYSILLRNDWRKRKSKEVSSKNQPTNLLHHHKQLHIRMWTEIRKRLGSCTARASAPHRSGRPQSQLPHTDQTLWGWQNVPQKNNKNQWESPHPQHPHPTQKKVLIKATHWWGRPQSQNKILWEFHFDQICNDKL